MNSLQLQQKPLPIQAAAVSTQSPARADDAMARHDDADRVAPDRRTYRPRCAGLADMRGHFPVRIRLSVRNRQQERPDRPLKRSTVHINRKIKSTADRKSVV